MEQLLREKIRRVLFESFLKEGLIDETLEDLENEKDYSEKFRIKAEQWAKEMNDLGPNSKVSLDKDAPPLFYTLRYAMEILAAAYLQGSGEFVLKHSGETFNINKGNIVKAINVALSPTQVNFPKFIGGKDRDLWFKNTAEKFPEAFAKLATNLFSDDSYTKRPKALGQYEKWTGQKINSTKELTKTDYYITNYLNSKSGWNLNKHSLLEFLKNTLSKKFQELVKDTRRKEQKVSLDAKVGDGGVTHGDMMQSPKEEQYQNIMGAAIKTIGEQIVNHNLVGKNNPFVKTYFKILLDVVVDRPELDSSAKRNKEILQMYETGTLGNPEFEQFFEDLWNYTGKQRGISNREKYGGDAKIMWQHEVKELKRKAQAEIKSNMGAIKQIAADTGLPAEQAAEIAVAYIIEKPAKVMATLKGMIEQMKASVNQDDEVSEPTQVSSSRLSSDEEAFYKEHPEMAPDYNDEGSREFVNIDDVNLQEGEAIDDNETYPSLAVIGKTFAKFINLQRKVGEINETRQYIKTVLFKSFLNKK